MQPLSGENDIVISLTVNFGLLRRYSNCHYYVTILCARCEYNLCNFSNTRTISLQRLVSLLTAATALGHVYYKWLWTTKECLQVKLFHPSRYLNRELAKIGRKSASDKENTKSSFWKSEIINIKLLLSILASILR